MGDDHDERRQVRAMWVVYRPYPSWNMDNVTTCHTLIVAICEHEATAQRYVARDPRCQYSVAAIDQEASG